MLHTTVALTAQSQREKKTIGTFTSHESRFKLNSLTTQNRLYTKYYRETYNAGYKNCIHK